MSRLQIGLFNDSFPPMIDGVAQTVKNYAVNLSRHDCDVTVATPSYRGASDEYEFDVVRYPSLPAVPRIGYRMGWPFGIETVSDLRARHFDLMHVHAPFASSVLVSQINRHLQVPVVLTYHTKFDLDFQKRLPDPASRKIALKFMLHNINAADEIWVVSRGCGEALRQIGYEGEFRIMENGTDFARGKADDAAVDALRRQYRIEDDAPVFLFVGRLMWYKNLRLILDTLHKLRENGLSFHCLIVGDGYDRPEIEAYAKELDLQDAVIFTGAVTDREVLRTYYSLADLFLFPSTFDTSGIVIKEAAACDCPSLLIKNSCAAEGVVHGVSGYLAEETADSCAAVIANACTDRAALKATGIRAGKDIYLSWEDAVHRAYDRYREILHMD